MKANKTTKPALAKKRTGGFVYKKRDPKTVRARAEQSGGKYDSIFKNGFDVYTAKAGDNCIRFLPPTWADADHYGYDIWVHGYIGNGSYLCPDKMLGKRCPICEASKESADAGEADEAKKLEPNRRVLTWVLDRDGDTKTPQLYNMSWSMDKDISTLADNKRSGEVLLIDHQDEGYDVSFKRTGTKLNTRYVGVAIDRETSPLSDRQKEQDKITAFIEENPLPTVLSFKSADFLEKVIAGTQEEKDEDLDEDADDASDDEEEENTRSSKNKSTKRVAPKKKKPARDEAEDEEEEDEDPPFDPDEDEEADPDEEEEEEEDTRRKPKVKVKAKPAKSKRRPTEEDEEEEEADPDEDEEEADPDEEDAEEEEEEEKPAKSKSKRKPAAREEPDEDEEEAEDDDGEEEESEEDEEGDDDGSGEEEEEEEEPRRRVKPKPKPTVKKKVRR